MIIYGDVFMLSNGEKKEKLELIRNLFIASTGMMPVVGGGVSVLLDKYLPSTIEKRRKQFLNQLENDFQRLPNDIIKNLENNEDFYSVLLKVLNVITCEHKVEKINAFRNILINSTIIIDDKFNEVDFFIKLINTLSIDQIRILHLFYLRDYKKTIEFKNVVDFIDENWEIDKSYRWSLVTELIRDGLISSSQERQRTKGDGHYLSAFGEDFICYIFNPVAMDEAIV